METTMASVNSSHIGPFSGLVSGIYQAFTRMQERRALMGLLDLPDYLLKDIGLQRDEITREGLKHFWE
jgi:uncharacterized protein YjiS (DUF1127 family)